MISKKKKAVFTAFFFLYKIDVIGFRPNVELQQPCEQLRAAHELPEPCFVVGG